MISGENPVNFSMAIIHNNSSYLKENMIFWNKKVQILSYDPW